MIKVSNPATVKSLQGYFMVVWERSAGRQVKLAWSSNANAMYCLLYW